MSEKTFKHTRTRPAERVFYIDDDHSSTAIHKGVVIERDGSTVVVRRNLGGESALVLDVVHNSNVFTAEQVASIADDHLPAIEPGQETTLQHAVDKIVDDSNHGPEIAARLAAAALANFATKQRTPEELGLRSVDELIGDEETRGSNAWKIQELISGYKNRMYPEGSANALTLSRPTEDISVLPENEAAEMKRRIAESNTAALNVLYDYFGVDFSRSYVYESAGRKNAVIQKTVYPAPQNGISFVETSIFAESTVNPDNKTSFDVSVVVGTPTFSVENGFYPAP